MIVPTVITTDDDGKLHVFNLSQFDKDYFEAQEKRFAEHLAQPKLFVPETVVAAQEGLFTAQG